MSEIQYVVRDVTKPIGSGFKVIVQVVNDIGAYGAGVSGAIARKCPTVEKKYREWVKVTGGRLPQGEVLFVRDDTDGMLVYANVVGQYGIVSSSNPTPVRYDSIETGLEEIFTKIFELEKIIGEYASVHMPRIGCGLAGGSWDKIEPLVKKHLSDRDIEVIVYDWL